MRQLLHTHHKDGVKTNNSEPNLIALCADCHSKEAFHEHLFVSHKERQTIISLRKQQLIINDHNSWQELFDYADSAVHGVLHMCQRNRTSMPEVGLDITNQHSEIIATAELAWPLQKIAVVLDDEEKHILQNAGWKSLRTDELIQNFERVHIN
ncbi:hypothetical protein BCU83_14840 [Vibrio breoganii]|uniref:hypothetical protein n=1 Tax=Vibrio breoganii TaxID=553239 RepID=UPI000C82F373|nr:hypothetical protein [Vibrio breoganii]PMG78006.1 hypothetical protein BCU83_14840 [Vibrio breoganii]